MTLLLEQMDITVEEDDNDDNADDNGPDRANNYFDP